MQRAHRASLLFCKQVPLPVLSRSCLGDKQVGKVLDRHLLEGLLVRNELEDLFDVRAVKVRLDVALKLGLEERALLATALVTDGVVDVDFGEDGAVVEGDGQGVRDEALLCRGGRWEGSETRVQTGEAGKGLRTRVVVVGSELLVLDTLHLRTMSTSFTSQQLSKFQSACPIDAPWHGAHRYAGQRRPRPSSPRS